MNSVRSPHTALLPFILGLLMLSGCPQFRDPSVPEPIHRRAEPNSGADYLLYVPSTYTRTQAWPLVVVCHGTEPWDTPLRLIRDWVKLAEEKGFLVAAPKLKGTRGDLPPPVIRQLELQRLDEQMILDVLAHVRGGYTLSEDRIFLSGWSAGSYAVLYTGLKHPELFRGLAVLKGNFNSGFLTPVADKIDPFQPVYVLYSSSDVLTGGQGPASVKWLQEKGAAVTEERSGSQHAHAPVKAFEFFERVVRRVPWLHIRAIRDERTRPATVQFKTTGSFEPATYDWDFGDGNSAPVASPEHTYASSGEYTVKLKAALPDGKQKITRQMKIKIP